MTLRETYFEIILGERGNAGNQHFFISPFPFPSPKHLEKWENANKSILSFYSITLSVLQREKTYCNSPSICKYFQHGRGSNIYRFVKKLRYPHPEDQI